MSGPLPSLLVPILMEELRPGQSGEDRVPTWAGGCSNFWGGVRGLPSPWSQHMLSACAAESRGRAEGSCLRVPCLVSCSCAKLPYDPVGPPSLSRAWTSHLHSEGEK